MPNVRRTAGLRDGPFRWRMGTQGGWTIDADKIQEVLALVEADRLGEAARLLGPLVRGKRFIRGGRSAPEADEIDEVKAWLREAIADPNSTGSRFLVERSYYKLRSQLPPPERRARGTATT
jgi:hypothetical protein